MKSSIRSSRGGPIAGLIVLLALTAARDIPATPDDLKNAVGDMLHPSHGRRAKTAHLDLARGRSRDLPEARARSVMMQASPSSYITPYTPPLLLVHGAADDVVVIHSTDEFVRSMIAVGVDITNLRFDDGHHGVMGQKGRTTSPAMHAFFQKRLSGSSDQPGEKGSRRP